MNFSQINYTMETPYQNKNIRMFGTLTQNPKFNRFNSTSPRKYLKTNNFKNDWSLENESQALESLDRRPRIYSQNISNIFSNQTVREKTQHQSISQKNNLNGQGSQNQTPQGKKKISSIDLNCKLNLNIRILQSICDVFIISFTQKKIQETKSKLESELDFLLITVSITKNYKQSICNYEKHFVQ
ncbi:unnamed protein product (macronuclear) [Paramecium tetraurelia]|uniref:Uncharacterized protein n=1 Tax=Paramecium tetraurelia TaxID=5888 RepID=A0BSW2_PARTE|nr:uncharacterized protein GSPATT00031861001 [Paramecium tetraurelia]CAK61629.1 unnamed protein product [Paramecium tetraurelia]|eukprot:XP_001429027.1 hypothetical protein (macronuclear) [Paramecium tetraurelia strain d4-2]